MPPVARDVMATKKKGPADAAATPAAEAAPKAKRTAKAARPPVAAADVAAPPEAAAPMAAPAVEPQPAPAPEPAPPPSRDEVARRAYELWLARGGSAFQNWVEAEKQLARKA